MVRINCLVIGFDGVDLTVLLTTEGSDTRKISLVSGEILTGECADDAAERIIVQFTGLKGVYAEQLHTFSRISDATRELEIIISYIALINYSDVKGRSRNANTQATWHRFKDLPQLSPEQLEMIVKAMRLLRHRTNVYPIVSSLLEFRFTITQLKKLYDAIFETSFDKRNFYKKMRSLGLLQRQNEKEKISSRKGSFYYVIKKNDQADVLSTLSKLYGG